MGILYWREDGGSCKYSADCPKGNTHSLQLIHFSTAGFPQRHLSQSKLEYKPSLLRASHWKNHAKHKTRSPKNPQQPARHTVDKNHKLGQMPSPTEMSTSGFYFIFYVIDLPSILTLSPARNHRIFYTTSVSVTWRHFHLRIRFVKSIFEGFFFNRISARVHLHFSA